MQVTLGNLVGAGNPALSAYRFLAGGGTRLGGGDSDSDSDETFQISRKLGLVHVEFFCLLDSQLWCYYITVCPATAA